MYEYKYFRFGKFKNPITTYQAPLVDNVQHNCPPSFLRNHEYDYDYIRLNASKYHFYKHHRLQTGSSVYIYCLPSFKDNFHNVYSQLCKASFDNVIHFWPSIIGNESYNFWQHIPEQKDGPQFMLILGEDNMKWTYKRTNNTTTSKHSIEMINKLF